MSKHKCPSCAALQSELHAKQERLDSVHQLLQRLRESQEHLRSVNKDLLSDKNAIVASSKNRIDVLNKEFELEIGSREAIIRRLKSKLLQPSTSGVVPDTRSTAVNTIGTQYTDEIEGLHERIQLLEHDIHAQANRLNVHRMHNRKASIQSHQGVDVACQTIKELENGSHEVTAAIDEVELLRRELRAQATIADKREKMLSKKYRDVLEKNETLEKKMSDITAEPTERKPDQDVEETISMSGNSEISTDVDYVAKIRLLESELRLLRIQQEKEREQQNRKVQQLLGRVKVAESRQACVETSLNRNVQQTDTISLPKTSSSRIGEEIVRMQLHSERKEAAAQKRSNYRIAQVERRATQEKAYLRSELAEVKKQLSRFRHTLHTTASPSVDTVGERWETESDGVSSAQFQGSPVNSSRIPSVDVSQYKHEQVPLQSPNDYLDRILEGLEFLRTDCTQEEAESALTRVNEDTTLLATYPGMQNAGVDVLQIQAICESCTHAFSACANSLRSALATSFLPVWWGYVLNLYRSADPDSTLPALSAALRSQVLLCKQCLETSTGDEEVCLRFLSEALEASPDSLTAYKRTIDKLVDCILKRSKGNRAVGFLLYASKSLISLLDCCPDRVNISCPSKAVKEFLSSCICSSSRAVRQNALLLVVPIETKITGVLSSSLLNKLHDIAGDVHSQMGVINIIHDLLTSRRMALSVVGKPSMLNLVEYARAATTINRKVYDDHTILTLIEILERIFPSPKFREVLSDVNVWSSIFAFLVAKLGPTRTGTRSAQTLESFLSEFPARDPSVVSTFCSSSQCITNLELVLQPYKTTSMNVPDDILMLARRFLDNCSILKNVPKEVEAPLTSILVCCGIGICNVLQELQKPGERVDSTVALITHYNSLVSIASICLRDTLCGRRLMNGTKGGDGTSLITYALRMVEIICSPGWVEAPVHRDPQVQQACVSALMSSLPLFSASHTLHLTDHFPPTETTVSIYASMFPVLFDNNRKLRSADGALSFRLWVCCMRDILSQASPSSCSTDIQERLLRNVVARLDVVSSLDDILKADVLSLLAVLVQGESTETLYSQADIVKMIRFAVQDMSGVSSKSLASLSFVSVLLDSMRSRSCTDAHFRKAFGVKLLNTLTETLATAVANSSEKLYGVSILMEYEAAKTLQTAVQVSALAHDVEDMDRPVELVFSVLLHYADTMGSFDPNRLHTIACVIALLGEMVRIPRHGSAVVKLKVPRTMISLASSSAAAPIVRIECVRFLHLCFVSKTLEPYTREAIRCTSSIASSTSENMKMRESVRPFLEDVASDALWKSYLVAIRK